MLRSIDLPLVAGPLLATLHLDENLARYGDMTAAAALATPTDLAAGQSLVFGSEGELNTTASLRPSYALHWLRNLSLNKLAATLPPVGLAVGSDFSADTNLTLSGKFTGIVTIEDGRLRLRWNRLDQINSGAKVSLDSTSQATIQASARFDKLLAALLGVPDLEPASLAKALSNLASYRALDPATQASLASTLGDLSKEADLATLLKPWLDLRNSLVNKSLDALQQKLTATLAASWQTNWSGKNLFDCSFDFTADGLAAYRKALTGDLSGLLASSAHSTLNSATFNADLTRQSQIEIHLPIFGDFDQSSRQEAVASAVIETSGQGRVVVYSGTAKSSFESRRNQYQTSLLLAASLRSGTAPAGCDFSLEYTDTRHTHPLNLKPVVGSYGIPVSLVPEENELDATITCTAPGAAVSAWCNAPAPGDRDYAEDWGRVAWAVQEHLRRWIPYIYFSHPERYGDVDVALPLIVYACTTPPAVPKHDSFTYDIMDRSSLGDAVASARKWLPAELTRTAAMLREAGKADLASFYDPERADRVLSQVLAQPRLIKLLLCYDAQLVRGLMNLSRLGNSLRDQIGRDPGKATSLLTRFSAGFVAEFHANLENVFTGKELIPLGSMLLVEAANALEGKTYFAQFTARIHSSKGDVVLTNTPA